MHVNRGSEVLDEVGAVDDDVDEQQNRVVEHSKIV